MKSEGLRGDLLRRAAREVRMKGPAPAGSLGECLDEEALILFYSERIPEERAEAIRDHLVACPKCLALAREAREFLDLREKGARPARFGSRRAGSRRALWRLAAAVLVLAGLGGMIWLALRPGPSPGGSDWRGLAIARAEYSELEFRGEGPSPAGQDSAPTFVEAMRPYVRGDDVAAEASLARYLERHPDDHDALFYRGVSLLLLGRLPEATASLQAARASPEEWVRGQAAWYLALARLKAGEVEAAARDLEDLSARGKLRRKEALELREEIRRKAGR